MCIFSSIVRIIKVITKLNVTYCVIISYASDYCLILLDTETRINFNLSWNLNAIKLSYEKKIKNLRTNNCSDIKLCCAKGSNVHL